MVRSLRECVPEEKTTQQECTFRDILLLAQICGGT